LREFPRLNRSKEEVMSWHINVVADTKQALNAHIRSVAPTESTTDGRKVSVADILTAIVDAFPSPANVCLHFNSTGHISPSSANFETKLTLVQRLAEPPPVTVTAAAEPAPTVVTGV